MSDASPTLRLNYNCYAHLTSTLDSIHRGVLIESMSFYAYRLSQVLRESATKHDTRCWQFFFDESFKHGRAIDWRETVIDGEVISWDSEYEFWDYGPEIEVTVGNTYTVYHLGNTDDGWDYRQVACGYRQLWDAEVFCYDQYQLLTSKVPLIESLGGAPHVLGVDSFLELLPFNGCDDEAYEQYHQDWLVVFGPKGKPKWCWCLDESEHANMR